MQLFSHPLQLVILDVDGVILDLMAGFERHLEAAARQLHLRTTPIRDYLAAVHCGPHHSFASLPGAFQAWWPALGPSDRRQFVECFRTLARQHPCPPVAGASRPSTGSAASGSRWRCVSGWAQFYISSSGEKQSNKSLRPPRQARALSKGWNIC
jgi:hypothetical protein